MNLIQQKINIITEEKNLFYKKLGNVIPVKIEKLSSRIFEVDQLIIESIYVNLLKHHKYVFKRNCTVVNGIICVDGNEYIIKIDDQNLENVGNISLYFIKNNFTCLADSNSLISYKKEIKPYGTFNTIKMYIPEEITYIDVDFVFSLCCSFFQLGYHWLNSTFIESVKKIASNLHQELYRFIRTMVHDSEHLEGFLFSVICQNKNRKEKDFVLIDEKLADGFIKLINTRSFPVNKSPIELVFHTIFEVVPIQESVILDVVRLKKVRDINLKSTSKYNNNSLANTLIAVWGETVCCHPIVTEGEFLLVAFYPKNKKVFLNPIIKNHCNEMVNISINNFKEIKKSLEFMDKIGNKENWLFYSELLGRFIAPIIDYQSKSLR